MQEFIDINTYQDLRDIVAGWKDGKLNLLILLGTPGTGKTQVVRDETGNEPHWFNGNVTAFGTYVTAYQYINRPLVFDDTDGLLRDSAGVRLLKCLCQNSREKEVSWVSNATKFYNMGLPSSFKTKSPVCIICNDFSIKSIHQSAVLDRGTCVRFIPDRLELATYALSWVKDLEVYTHVTSLLPKAHRPSLRLYTLAMELKNAGLNWKAMLENKLHGAIL